MIFNNTKVIQARLHFRKETGALIEVFLMEPAEPTDYELMFQTTGHCSWLCMIGNLKKWKEGSLKRDFEIKGNKLTLSATMRRGDALGSEAQKMVAKGGGTNYWVDFDWDNAKVSFAEILEAVGELPIPPYLNRKTEESDHAAVAVQQHELVFILIGKLLHHAPQRQTAAGSGALGGIAVYIFS